MTTVRKAFDFLAAKAERLRRRANFQGENHGGAKLTEAQVLEIRRLRRHAARRCRALWSDRGDDLRHPPPPDMETLALTTMAA